jgi:hypothetical protein
MTAPRQVARRLARLTPRGRAVLAARLRSLLAAVGTPAPAGASTADLVDRLAALLGAPAPAPGSAAPGDAAATAWLAAATVHAELPLPAGLRRLQRLMQLDGPWAGVQHLLDALPDRRRGDLPAVVAGRVVDVTGLLGDGAAPGREVGRRLAIAWSGDPDVVLVTWTSDARALRRLDAAEAERLGVASGPAAGEPIVPARDAAYLLVGAVVRPRAAERLIALGGSGIATAGIGVGLGPLLDHDAHRMPEGAEARFSWHLAAQRTFGRLAVLGDDAVLRQYAGWKVMLRAIGVVGPELVPLPSDASASDVARVLAPAATPRRLGES